jgi:drug/metabolite transporter (DMT)-like permease
VLAVGLSLTAALLWGVADFLAGLASRRIPVPVVLLCVELGGLVVIGAVTLASGEPLPPAGTVLLALAAGAAGVTALGCFYAALARGTMSVVAPIGATGVALPVVVGLAGGDSPSAVAALGLAAAAVGCVLASRETTEGGEAAPRDRSVLLLAGLAAVGFGTFFVLFDRAAEDSELWALTLLRVVAIPLVGPLALAALRGPEPPAGRLVLPVLAVGVVDMAATACLALANNEGELSVVSVLGSLYPVVTVVLAGLVLHERLRPAQLAGVGLALTGVVLVAAG